MLHDVQKLAKIRVPYILILQDPGGIYFALCFFTLQQGKISSHRVNEKIT